MNTPSKHRTPLPIYLIFLFTLCYWIYHVIISQMIIVQDASVYENIGKIIYEQGWIGYFKSGPTREPLYPFFISISMLIQDKTHVPYQDIQKIFQFIFAFAAQFLFWQIFKKLNIRIIISSIILLFFAVSPDIVNSIVSLFSEVMALPLTLIIILLLINIRKTLLDSNHSYRRLLILSFLLGAIFLLLILVKGAFEFVFPFLLLSFVPFIYFAKKNEKTLIIKKILIVICILLTSIHLPLHLIKTLNKKYNGNYVLTNRGAFMLYGNTTRQLEDFSFKRIAIGFICITQASEQKICKKLFSEKDCAYWDFRRSDAYALEKCSELASQGKSEEKANKILVQLAINKILHNPFHYLPYFCLEGLAVVFWKSGEIGFVAYPNWLSYLYDKTYIRSMLSLISAVITLFALLNLAILNAKNLRQFFYKLENNEFYSISFYSALIAFSFIALHATISVQTRYCLPIVPLYLIAISIFLNQLMNKKTKITSNLDRPFD